ncbi:LacI family DNA-binding transcriptional regulator [Paracoccus methylarcula]|uniref:LacI family DNA-binding transcriptional regulator n=1 Tax=Paracoccus methylarcula TaxID=72022 RepID=A0A422R0K4_9RHOB|nr:LacI family DNA-binding transcriptional regulator [Paracoccus methylarcula]RNF35683.1 LacI family DNA-binding transcriptional regulator [Paracoccus methylarcula]
MSRPTIHDVARVAGVSLSTVDRVLNGREGVKGATQSRVAEAIRQLGYERNIAAANLSRKRRYRLLFILPGGGNSFMRGLEQEIVAQMDAWEFTVISVTNVPAFDDAALADALRRVDPQETDGVALVATDSAIVRAALAELRGKGIAAVTLVSDLPSSQRQRFVGIDNVQAGRTAASLLGRFCRWRPGRIALVAGSMLVRDHAERRLGFEQVLRSEFPVQEVLPPLEGFDDQEIVGDRLADMLSGTPGVVGIYSLGAGNRGVARAIASLPPERRPSVVVHELTTYSREALLDGSFDAVIHQDRAQEIRVAVELLQALIDGSPIDPDGQRIGVEVYLRDNLP